MANRTFQDVQSVHREVKILSFVAKCGGSNAVTFHQGDPGLTGANAVPAAIGVETIGSQHSGAVLTVKLSDKYSALLSALSVVKNPGATTTDPTQVLSITEDVAGVNGSVDDQTVNFTFDQNLGDGDEFYVTLFLKNTSVAR
jgi:hypothetical protein